MDMNAHTGFWDAADYGNTPRFNSKNSLNIFINEKDKNILRKYATRVAELANRNIESEKRKLWYCLNSLKPSKPLVFCDPEGGWNEIIREDMLECKGELAKRWEIVLRKEIFWGEYLKDDKVIEGYFEISHIFNESNWGLEAIRHGGDNGGSYVWDAPLKAYRDIEKLKYPEITVDYKKTIELYELAKDTFLDLLEVKIRDVWWWSLGMTDILLLLRGMENVMIDMSDNPSFIHEIMSFISNGIMNKINFLERNGLLSLNKEAYVGSGGFGYTDELPKDNYRIENVRTIDMWGFSESQESVGISPKMFNEFIFKYQLPILKLFGLNCYGCCEPLDNKLDIIKKIPNLRRVSVSPWSDKKKMADNLGNKYVYSMKLIPTNINILLDNEEAVRTKIKNLLIITKDCPVEIILKDILTINQNPEKLIKIISVIKEEIEKLFC